MGDLKSVQSFLKICEINYDERREMKNEENGFGFAATCNIGGGAGG
jgi:hypothetical protein